MFPTGRSVAQVDCCFLLLLAISLFLCNVVEVQSKIQSSRALSLSQFLNDGQENQSSSPVGSDFVLIPQPPRFLQHRFPLIVQFRCNQSAVIGVEVLVWSELQDAGVIVFRRRFNCSSQPKKVQHRMVRLKLPRYIAYRPGEWNRYSVVIDRAVIRTWILDAEKFELVKALRTFYRNATAKDEISVGVVPAFERSKRPRLKCLPWWRNVTQPVYDAKCHAELEVVHLIKFPLALSGRKVGVHRKINEYRNFVLKQLRQRSFDKPRYSFLVWLYVVDYCPHGSKLCGLFHHLTWDDRYATPQLAITKAGQIHFETIMENGTSRIFETPMDFVIPKEEWVQLVLSCETFKCILTLRRANNWQSILSTVFEFSLADEPYFDETVGFFVCGGSEVIPSFQGYIGQAIFYRRRLISTDQTLLPSKYHPMFELGLNQREHRCRQYIQQVNYVIYQAASLLNEIIRKKSCKRDDKEVFLLHKNESETAPTCKVYNAPRSPNYTFVYGIVQRWTLDGSKFSLADIGNALLKNATYLLERNNMREMEKVIFMLKQGSCYGNHDATFMLSVILNYGISTSVQEIQSHSYLMYGAMDANRLCLLSLGNKHAFGLDGFPGDDEQSYVYYKAVADMTRFDLEDHRNDDVYTELVRLTDTAEVAAQTEETGDYFLWVKHQAAQGVLHAQQNMAQMLYWGSQGVQRDVKSALEYYRLSAESGEPSALYDYGIVLLKGHGTEKNMTLAMEVLEKAAAKNHPESLNTVGWHALEVEKNFSKAVHYFERSYDLGNKDAAYNLAHMYLRGLYPNSGIDRVKAWDYLADGALRGQLEAGTLVAMFNMRGHPKITRNVRLALDWARYVSEKNPATGILLAKGLKAYRKNNWPTAFVYYVMSASTGVEVANFNLAYLCEEDSEGLVAFMAKECKWRHYNLSTQRAAKDVNPYAWIKMAEYHYYGSARNKRDPQAAADMYCNAALKGDPQGLFSLAYLVEEGIQIAETTWQRLQVPASVTKNSFSLLTHLYSRCKESINDEAFIPCTVALYRIQAIYLWEKYYIFLLMLASIGLGSALTFGIQAARLLIRGDQQNLVDSV